MFTVPSHHFSGDLSEGRVARSVSELGVRVIAGYKEIVSELAIPLAVILFSIFAEWTCARSGDNGMRNWCQRNRWALLLFVGLAGIPAAIIGRIKEGGEENALVYVTYFFAAAATLSLVDLSLESGPMPRHSLAAAAKVLLLALTIALAVPYLPPRARLIASGLTLSGNCQQQAYAFAKTHPGQVYYPWHPLATLMAEGELYHFSYGVFDRELAGYPLSEEHFRRHVPPRMRYVAYFEPQERYIERYLPEFSHRVVIPELPGWEVFVREDTELQPERPREAAVP